MTATSLGGASWQRLAGERSSTIAGFGLLTLEGALSFVVVAPKPGQSLTDRVHRQLRVWALDGGPPAHASKLPDCAVELPASVELALAADGDKVVVAAIQNFDHPGLAGAFPSSGWAGARGAAAVVPVDLAQDQLATISLPLSRTWSTWTFPCEQWLFDPRVHEGVL